MDPTRAGLEDEGAWGAVERMADELGAGAWPSFTPDAVA